MTKNNKDQAKKSGLSFLETRDLSKLPIPEKQLPSGIREFVENAHASRKVATLISAIPPLGVLDARVRLDYPYDKHRQHALIYQVIVEGDPSAGKSFVAEIVNRIIKPTLGERDEIERQLETEYKEKKARRSANEKLAEAPVVTPRCIPLTVSKTNLVKRIDAFKRKYGEYLTCWMFGEELAQLSDASKTAFSCLRTIMRVAYDVGAEYGQDYMSENSYSAIVDIRLCVLMCATPIDVDKYMDKQSVMGGNVTRNIVIFLKDELGAKPAVSSKFTDEQESSLNKTLQKLMDCCYIDSETLHPIINLDTSWLNKHIDRWHEKVSREAVASGSTALDVFRKRASVNAFRCVGLIYHLYQLEGKLEEKRIRTLCCKMYNFLADFILHGVMERWGAQYDEYYKQRAEGMNVSEKPRIIDLCTKEFTRNQLELVLEKEGSTTPSRQYIYLWKKNGLIKEIAVDTYQKLI